MNITQLGHILELRQYTLHASQRDVLIDLFEREFLAGQEAVGIQVLGQFRDDAHPDWFVWLRGFPDMTARKEALEAFYFGPVWRAHRDAANATMIDSDNVLLLQPATPNASLAGGVAVSGTQRFTVATLPVQAHAAAASAVRFDQEQASLATLGARTVGCYVTAPEENTFPQLPVRTDHRYLVWFAVTEQGTEAVVEAHLARWWQQAPEADHNGPLEVLNLTPTEQSRIGRGPEGAETRTRPLDR